MLEVKYHAPLLSVGLRRVDLGNVLAGKRNPWSAARLTEHAAKRPLLCTMAVLVLLSTLTCFGQLCLQRYTKRKANPVVTNALCVIRGYEQAMERLFGVDPSCWSSSGSDGVLEAFTQSHPRVPKEREAAVR